MRCVMQLLLKSMHCYTYKLTAPMISMVSDNVAMYVEV